MPRLKQGDQAPNILLRDTEGVAFNLDTYRGKKVLLSFYRFATCPFCNLRIHKVVKEYPRYREHFEVIAIFESQDETLRKAMRKYEASFRIMSDSKGLYYDAYALEKSFIGVIKGMLFRMPSLIKSMMMGNFPTQVDSAMTRMPADFLIDENGIIQIAYYGKDEGDHLDIDTLISTQTKEKL